MFLSIIASRRKGRRMFHDDYSNFQRDWFHQFRLNDWALTLPENKEPFLKQWHGFMLLCWFSGKRTSHPPTHPPTPPHNKKNVQLGSWYSWDFPYGSLKELPIGSLLYCYNGAKTLYFLMEPALGGELSATYHRRGLHGSEVHAKFYIAGLLSPAQAHF